MTAMQEFGIVLVRMSLFRFLWWFLLVVPLMGFAGQVHRPVACFSEVPKIFRAPKAICKTPTRLFFKAGLFICCKGNKNENNCKVSCLEKTSFWRYKMNYYVTRNAPEKFREFSRNGSDSAVRGPGISVFGLPSCLLLVKPLKCLGCPVGRLIIFVRTG